MECAFLRTKSGQEEGSEASTLEAVNTPRRARGRQTEDSPTPEPQSGSVRGETETDVKTPARVCLAADGLLLRVERSFEKLTFAADTAARRAPLRGEPP